MSTDHVGHLGFARFDPDHPAHAVTGSATSCYGSTRRSTGCAAS